MAPSLVTSFTTHRYKIAVLCVLGICISQLFQRRVLSTEIDRGTAHADTLLWTPSVYGCGWDRLEKPVEAWEWDVQQGELWFAGGSACLRVAALTALRSGYWRLTVEA